MNRKNFMALAVAAVMLLSFTACNNNTESTDTQTSQGTSQTAPTGASVLTADTAADTVIATLKGDVEKDILFGDFLKEYKYYLSAYNITDDNDPNYASILTSRREYIVNYLINEVIMQTQFEKLGLSLTDEENKQIDKDTEAGAASIKETLKMKIQASLAEGETLSDEELATKADEAFDKLLADCGLSYDDFRNWQKSIVVQNKLSAEVNKDYSMERSEADAQAEKLIADIQSSYKEDPSTYNADTMCDLWIPEGARNIRHILIRFDEDTTSKINALRLEKKDEEADKLREEKLSDINAEVSEVQKKLDEGGDFAALMKEHSDDGDTSRSYLIVPGTTAYMDGFAETALAISEVGGISTCVTDYGYHFIEYTSDAVVSETAKKEYIDGLYDYLVEANKTKNFSEAMTTWRSEYTIEIDRDILLLAEEDTAEAQ